MKAHGSTILVLGDGGPCQSRFPEFGSCPRSPPISPTLSAQGEDAVNDGLRGAARAMTGTRRAIVETGFAFAAVAGEPTPGGAF